MGNKPIPKPHLQPNQFKKLADKAKGLESLDREVFMVSFRQLDKNQGQKFHDWEQKNLLADALETIYGYSQFPLIQQLNKKFKIYGGFPPKEKTSFFHPAHISPDANWASIHIKGEPCLIGHVYRNTFFLVFLDCDHSFWKSELKNT